MILPIPLLESAGARYVEQRQMRGITGPSVLVRLYLVSIHIAGEAIHGLRVVGLTNGTDALIGRDVLNQLRLTLDGPALALRIE